jgi:hypothetical protein
MIAHEIRYATGPVTWFIARHSSGAAGSVTLDRRLGRTVSEGRHLPVRLAAGPTYEGERPFDCNVTGEPSYCDGTTIGTRAYTTDDDMLDAAESWIPWEE